MSPLFRVTLDFGLDGRCPDLKRFARAMAQAGRDAGLLAEGDYVDCEQCGVLEPPGHLRVRVDWEDPR